MATFRSNSSANTNLTVTISEIGRADTRVLLRCNWSATLGSASSLGAGTGNYRYLYLRKNDGTVVASTQIKTAAESWAASSTHSGSFDFWLDVGTWNAGSISLTPYTNATGTASCVWTTYVSAISVSYSLTWSDATPASALSLSPNPFEGVVTFSWTRGADGTNNAISEYHIYYRVNQGAETGVNAGNNAAFALDLTSVPRGSVIDFRVAAIAPHNIAWSGYSLGAKRNSAPYAPTSASVPKTSYIPGETIPVSFAGNGDADNNLTGYEVAAIDGETVGETIVASGTVSPINIDTTGWVQGSRKRFRVRAIDAFGVRSGWSNYTAEVTLNTEPNSPSITYPIAGKTVYSRRPRILLTGGATNDGPENVLGILGEAAERTTAGNGSLFSCGIQVFLPTGRKIVYKPGSDYGNTPTIGARMFDGYLYSPTVSRSFNIATLSLTDPDISTPGMKIKAVHITELRTAINALRAAYGLPAASFTSMTAGVTQIGNAAIITELQTAIQAVINVINGWDANSATFDISVSWINPAATGGGVDRIKLRQAIEQIRSIIPTI